MVQLNDHSNTNQEIYDSTPSIYETKVRRAHELNFYSIFPENFKKYFGICKEYSMLSRERLYDFYTSINYVVDAKIEGDIVEIGCWAGGSISLARMVLNETIVNGNKREVYGYDTFEGHAKPLSDEIDIWGKNQAELFDELDGKPWAKQSEESVKRNILRLVGNDQGIKLIKGKVEETSKKIKPKKISILRIDVDWYEPTLNSLEQFYPLIEPGGILIVDDYGHFSGSRKAVDLYFKDKPIKFFHTDYSCITAIKNS